MGNTLSRHMFRYKYTGPLRTKNEEHYRFSLIGIYLHTLGNKRTIMLLFEMVIVLQRCRLSRTPRPIGSRGTHTVSKVIPEVTFVGAYH